MRLFLWFSNTVFGKERCLVWSLFCLNDDGALMLTSSYFPVPVCWPCNTFYPCLLYPWHMHASHSAYGAAKPRELLKQTGTITFFSTRKRWVVLFWKEMDPWVSTKRTCFWFSYTVTKTNRWKNRKKEETKIFGEEEKCFCFSSFLSPLHLSKSQ